MSIETKIRTVRGREWNDVLNTQKFSKPRRCCITPKSKSQRVPESESDLSEVKSREKSRQLENIYRIDFEVKWKEAAQFILKRRRQPIPMMLMISIKIYSKQALGNWYTDVEKHPGSTAMLLHLTGKVSSLSIEAASIPIINISKPSVLSQHHIHPILYVKYLTHILIPSILTSPESIIVRYVHAIITVENSAYLHFQVPK